MKAKLLVVMLVLIAVSFGTAPGARADCAAANSALNHANADESKIASSAAHHLLGTVRVAYRALVSDLNRHSLSGCSDRSVMNEYDARDLTRWYAGSAYGFERAAVAGRQMRLDIAALKSRGFDKRYSDMFALFVGETAQVLQSANLDW